MKINNSLTSVEQVLEPEKKKRYEAGHLVKNTREDLVGVIIGEDHPHLGYWKVLADGEVVRWFENNLTQLEKEHDNAFNESAIT
tara:strand:- start:317 stop:568 length:252 start_codon:yes stop_codon:yes gene_type:complete